jgi:CHAT domain-containing protein
VFLKPIEHHLEQMVKQSKTGKPSLLIIPQADTFNIPYAALRLKNGEHLCHQVTLLEAFSFHSFIHSTGRMESTKEDGKQMEESLVIGNPTNHLRGLPFAQQEAEMIAQRLGVTPLIGYLATRSKVASHLPSAPIIHFACHGSNDGRCLFLAPEKEW